MKNRWLGAFLAPFILLATTTCGGVAICSGWWCVGWVPPPCYGCAYGASVTAADFDGDGNQDVATGTRGRGLVGVAFGNGAGGVLRESVLDEGTGASVDFLRAGMLDADAHVDLVVIDKQRGELRVLRGDGHGGFGPAGGPISVGALADVVAIAVGRLDGDERDDVFVLDAQGRLMVLRPDPQGRFASNTATILPLNVGTGTVDVALAHVDADAHLDAILLDAAARTVTVLAGDGLGGFDLGGPSAPAGPMPAAIAAGELDGAPGDDVAVVDASDGKVRILFSNGAGMLIPSSQGPLPLPGARGDRVLVVPNAAAPDAPADLAVAYHDASQKTGIVGFANDGRGTFAGPGISLFVGVLGDWCATDLNHDGRTDLVIGDPEGNALGLAIAGPQKR